MIHTPRSSPISTSSTTGHHHLPATGSTNTISAHPLRGRRMARLLHLGVRWQLTCWYTAIFGFLLLLASIVIYINLGNALAVSPDAALKLRAQQLADGVKLEKSQITTHGEISDLPGFDPADDRLTSQADVNFDNLVRLLDVQQKVVFQTPAFQQIHVPGESITQPLRGTPWQGTVVLAGHQEVRIYSRTIADDGKVFAVIQVGASLNQVQSVQQQMTTELVVVACFVLILGALGSYWMTGRAFAPIRHLIEVARTIKAGDLRQRVPVPQTSDEVQALALTFNEMLTSLEQTLNRQHRFVSDASHELRTPVTVIRSKTDLALQQPGELEECLTVLRQINGESERLGHLINNLLVLARADEGKASFEKEMVPLHLLAEAVAANAEALTLERNISLHVETRQPVQIRGDEARLIQVIMNLLDNAIRNTGPGGHVTLKISGTPEHAMLTVQDTGVGIQPEHLPYIFDRFYRVDSARAHSIDGNSGLGLAIVAWIVQGHQGTIDVYSQPGHGSTFKVTLPRR